MRPPVVVRLQDFPEQLRLVRGSTPPQQSAVLVQSERDANIAVSMRLPYEPFTFENGETAITQIESFTAGEQREIVLDWALRDETDAYVQYVYLEIDVRYEDEEDSLNTATVAIPLNYGMGLKRLALIGAITAAAVGTAIMTATRRAVRAYEEDDVTIGIVEVDVPKRTTRPRKSSSAAKKSSRAAASSTKKGSTSKQGATSKQGGETRRGSSPSGSAQRTGGRGSSGARKSSPRPSTRKSR
jgi:hypothetical protein